MNEIEKRVFKLYQRTYGRLGNYSITSKVDKVELTIQAKTYSELMKIYNELNKINNKNEA